MKGKLVRIKRVRPRQEGSYDIWCRFHPGWTHPDNAVARSYASPVRIDRKMQLSKIIQEQAIQAGSAHQLRVFEIGAGSGRLASYLVRKNQLNPENYVIGDLDYPKRPVQPPIGPRLKRPTFTMVKKKGMKQIHTNLMTKAPTELTQKFHLLIIPNVFRPMVSMRDFKDREFAEKLFGSILTHYLPLLEPNGIMVINRFSDVLVQERFFKGIIYHFDPERELLIIRNQKKV